MLNSTRIERIQSQKKFKLKMKARADEFALPACILKNNKQVTLIHSQGSIRFLSHKIIAQAKLYLHLKLVFVVKTFICRF